jgi:5-methylcytosine-specific restriction endonuclease McrA
MFTIVLIFMSYSLKLKDPRWQRKRLEILTRDNFTCQECFSTVKELNVHHLVYRRRDPWDYPNYCYQTLCVECHKERQELTDKIVDAMRLALKNIKTPMLMISAQRICNEAMIELEATE